MEWAPSGSCRTESELTFSARTWRISTRNVSTTRRGFAAQRFLATPRVRIYPAPPASHHNRWRPETLNRRLRPNQEARAVGNILREISVYSLNAEPSEAHSQLGRSPCIDDRQSRCVKSRDFISLRSRQRIFQIIPRSRILLFVRDVRQGIGFSRRSSATET